MAVFCCAVALTVAAVPAREVSGVKMPEVVSVAGRDLRLNGMGVRKMHLFFEVYVVGLYLEKPTTEARAAITTSRNAFSTMRSTRSSVPIWLWRNCRRTAIQNLAKSRRV